MGNTIQEFNEVQAKADAALQVALAAEVTDSDSAAVAKSQAVELKDIEKLIEDKRKELVKPYNDKVSEINAAAKALAAPIGQGKTALADKLLAWQNEERMNAEIAAAEEKARLEAMAAEMAESEDATLEEVEAVQERAQAYAEPVKMMKHEKPLAVREVWKCEIKDFKALAEYAVKTGQLWLLLPNESEIGKRVRAAQGPLRTLPGCEIWSEQSAVIR
jgi:hypothetical protein